jgi:hypothetical protein
MSWVENEEKGGGGMKENMLACPCCGNMNKEEFAVGLSLRTTFDDEGRTFPIRFLTPVALAGRMGRIRTPRRRRSRSGIRIKIADDALRTARDRLREFEVSSGGAVVEIVVEESAYRGRPEVPLEVEE